jgi:hypothetical protein
MAKTSKARFFRVSGTYIHPSTGVSFQVLKIRPNEKQLNIKSIDIDGSSSTTSIDLVKHKKMLQRGEIEEI